jgi:hypothetical protein
LLAANVLVGLECSHRMLAIGDLILLD